MNTTILIVDDDNMLRNALAKGLRNEGFNAITSASAENAGEILAKFSVDAIVLDRMMTGMDGLTFLNKLRKSGNNTPIIMLTAMTGPENAIAGLASGANDYLAKPFQVRELILRLQNIMQHHTPPSTAMPRGLAFNDGDFVILGSNGAPAKILALSGEEKKLLESLTSPVGNVAPSSPMVAKRLRNKLNIVLSHLDIVTVRGRGYKLVDLSADN